MNMFNATLECPCHIARLVIPVSCPAITTSSVPYGGPRTKAFQRIDVDAARPKSNFFRRFDRSPTMTGLKTMTAPVRVSAPRAVVFSRGECW